jgi:hypothetical protein
MGEEAALSRAIWFGSVVGAFALAATSSLPASRVYVMRARQAASTIDGFDVHHLPHATCK